MSATAKQLAYATGIRQLYEVALRIEALERTVTEQQATIAALQSSVLALRHPTTVAAQLPPTK